jgi:hypothetical protein
MALGGSRRQQRPPAHAARRGGSVRGDCSARRGDRQGAGSGPPAWERPEEQVWPPPRQRRWPGVALGEAAAARRGDDAGTAAAARPDAGLGSSPTCNFGGLRHAVVPSWRHLAVVSIARARQGISQTLRACYNACVDVYARVCSCRQCWASKCRDL